MSGPLYSRRFCSLSSSPDRWDGNRAAHLSHRTSVWVCVLLHSDRFPVHFASGASGGTWCPSLGISVSREARLTLLPCHGCKVVILCKLASAIRWRILVFLWLCACTYTSGDVKGGQPLFLGCSPPSSGSGLCADQHLRYSQEVTTLFLFSLCR